MPVVEFSDDELEALLAVHTIAARVDRAAYDRARLCIVEAGRRHLESKGPHTVNDVAVTADAGAV